MLYPQVGVEFFAGLRHQAPVAESRISLEADQAGVEMAGFLHHPLHGYRLCGYVCTEAVGVARPVAVALVLLANRLGTTQFPDVLILDTRSP